MSADPLVRDLTEYAGYQGPPPGLPPGREWWHTNLSTYTPEPEPEPTGPKPDDLKAHIVAAMEAALANLTRIVAENEAKSTPVDGH